MAARTTEELRREVARLEHENAELTARLARSGPTPGDGSESRPSSATTRRRAWGWTLLATVLVVIGSLLAPVSIVSVWAGRELSDTQYFVDTFAPLATKPAVQNVVIDQSVKAIEANVDIQGLTASVFQGIEQLGLPPRAAQALNLLQAPAVAGIKSLITSSVTKFVRSDAFAEIWRQALTTTHQQLLATMNGSSNAAVTIGSGGEIGLQLGPIISAVKQHLVAQGITFAKNIPTIDKTIVLAKSSSAALYMGLYQLVVAVGVWLPWVTLVFLAAGVLVARRRGIALLWASFALGLTMVLVTAGITVGAHIFQVSVADVLPAAAASVVYGGILGFVQNIVTAIAVLAFTVFVVALLSGPFRWAAALRGYAGSGFAAVRRGAESHGITTGRVGDWMYQQRVWLRVIVALAAAAIILFVRPPTPPLIVWTAVIAVVVVAILELLARPPVVSEAEAAPSLEGASAEGAG